MERMKTLLIYVLLLIAFFIVSVVLEEGLLQTMYSKIPGEFDGYYEETDKKFTFENVSAKACNINGYINFQLFNATEQFVEQCYLKIDLYNSQDLLADTDYVQVSNMEAGALKTYNIKFNANHIKRYEVSVIKDIPENSSNIIEILGWRIDLTDVFGRDLSNTTIFGQKITDIFSWDNIKTTGHSFWNWFALTLQGVPGWAYAFAWLFYVGLL